MQQPARSPLPADAESWARPSKALSWPRTSGHSDDMAPRSWRHPARSSLSWDPWERAWPHQGPCAWGTGEARPEISLPETRLESLGHPSLSGRLPTEQRQPGQHMALPSEKTPEAVRPLHAGGHDVGGRGCRGRLGCLLDSEALDPSPTPCPSVPSCLLLPRTHHPKDAQRPQDQQQEGPSSHGGRGNSRVTGSVNTLGSLTGAGTEGRAGRQGGACRGGACRGWGLERAGPGEDRAWGQGGAWGGRGLGRAGPGQSQLTKCSGGTETYLVQVRQVLPVPSQPGSADKEGGAPWRILHGQGSGTPVAQGVPAAMPGGWDDHGPKGQLEARASPAWSACMRKPSSAGTVCKGFG